MDVFIWLRVPFFTAQRQLTNMSAEQHSYRPGGKVRVRQVCRVLHQIVAHQYCFALTWKTVSSNELQEINYCGQKVPSS